MSKKALWQAVKFTLFSVSAGIIQIGSFTLMNELLHLRYWPEYLISLVLSILWNFTLNRRYTFKSAANVLLPWRRASDFIWYSPLFPLGSDKLQKMQA